MYTLMDKYIMKHVLEENFKEVNKLFEAEVKHYLKNVDFLGNPSTIE